MAFWGCGRKTLTTSLAHERALLTSYRQLAVLFVFTLCWGYRHALVADTVEGRATREITHADARELTAGGVLPRPGPWKRYSLWALPLLLVVGGLAIR